MSVRRAIAEKDGLYFITFSCKNWLPLFELTNSYDAVYKWFDHLKTNSHYITGYVILPQCWPKRVNNNQIIVRLAQCWPKRVNNNQIIVRLASVSSLRPSPAFAGVPRSPG